VFFVGNYFVTFFIIRLIAAGISLLNKPKPLRIGEVVGLVLPIDDILMPIVGFVFLWLSYKHPQPGTANRNLI